MTGSWDGSGPTVAGARAPQADADVPRTATSGAAPDEQERQALAALLAAVEPATRDLAGVLRDHGAVAVLDALRRDPPPGGAARWRWRAGVRARLGGVDGARELERGRGGGLRLVAPGDEEWPGWPGDGATRSWPAEGTGAAVDGVTGSGDSQVPGSHVPPVAVWVRGDGHLADLLDRSVAVVGSRACTSYGVRVAASLAAGLAGRACTTVSGAAYGVDAAAHRAALASGGPTAAVLAAGADVAYPAGHDRLLDEVAGAGLVVSEAPPGLRPTRQRFLSRNRLLAGWTRGVVLVEAGLRSGARSTCGHAHRLGRPVLVVPGPVDSPASAGCHAELRGAAGHGRPPGRLVVDAAQVLEEVGDMGELADAAQAPDSLWDTLDGPARTVLEALPARGEVDAAVLAGRLGRPAPEVLRLLGRLALDDLAERRGAGWGTGPSAREVVRRRA